MFVEETVDNIGNYNVHVRTIVPIDFQECNQP